METNQLVALVAAILATRSQSSMDQAIADACEIVKRVEELIPSDSERAKEEWKAKMRAQSQPGG